VPACPEPLPAAPLVSVIVPVRDEAENIRALVGEITAALAGRAFEIVYVDDGSRDATLAVLRDAMAAEPRLRVLAHDKSYGQSAAILTGVRAAQGAIVATLDGDGQNDPADLPRLLARYESEAAKGAAAMVIGWRHKRRDTAVKRLSSRIANTVRAALLGDDTRDTGCGLKVFPRAWFLETPGFDHMHRFLPALAKRTGLAVLAEPVNHRPRIAGRSKYGVWNRLWVGIVDLVGVMWLLKRQSRPQARPVTRETPRV
jgi:dolichol-phosphate mannosyltransferase